MPIRYYYLNKTVLCIKKIESERELNNPKLMEFYTVRDVVCVNGKFDFLLYEITNQKNSLGNEYSFPMNAFILICKSWLNDAELAIRSLLTHTDNQRF